MTVLRRPPVAPTRTKKNHADTGQFQKRKANSPPAPVDRSTDPRPKICDEPIPPLAQNSRCAAKFMFKPTIFITPWATTAKCKS